MATSDPGHNKTDEELEALEKRIASVYREAAADVQNTITEYFAGFAERDEKQQARLASGEITKQEYNQWRLNQMGRGESFQSLQNEVAERYTNANEVAVSYINDSTPSVYSLNRNYAAYTIEQTGKDIGYTLWNESTVRRMLVEEPDVMPYYPEQKALNRGIDLAYGKQQIAASVTSGILQGNSVYKIADDLMKRVQTMNRDSAVRSARTAFTAAENAGRQDEYEAAEDMGIEMEKMWVSTLDERTRESHAMADGQTVPVDEPFIVGGDELMYPGDPDGSPEEIYNCRCTMITQIKGVDMSDAERRGSGERFDQWLEQHQNLAEPEPAEPEEPQNPLLDALADSGIEYREVADLDIPLTVDEIIDKLAGGDLTSGSCASLAMAYAGNELGYDVTDYRGGDSRKWFSENYWGMVKSDSAFMGKSGNGFIPADIYTARSQVTAGNKALSAVEPGNEYILCCGKHASVVQKTSEGKLQYLELQSGSKSGWTDFDGNARYTLSWRFGCKRSGANYSAALTNINDLKDNAEFKKALGYLNTATDQQQKGTYGSIK